MEEFTRFREIVARLRGEGGCPWDRAQTHESLKATCIEEAAEVVCGINILRETGNPDNLKEELGDLLLQVVIQAQIAEDEGLFTIEDVCEGVSAKMIRRHPHVFGNGTASTPEEAYASWTEVKKLEKAGKEEVGRYLPAAFEEAKELIEVAERRKGYKPPLPADAAKA